MCCKNHLISLKLKLHCTYNIQMHQSNSKITVVYFRSIGESLYFFLDNLSKKYDFFLKEFLRDYY